jgi:hypothetical protein
LIQFLSFPRNPGFEGDVVYHEQCSSPLKTGYCLQRNFSSTYQEFHRFIQFQKNRSYHRVIGLSSSSVPRDLLTDIQTEEDLQAIFEANSVSTDNTDTDTAISETEHSPVGQIESSFVPV